MEYYVAINKQVSAISIALDKYICTYELASKAGWGIVKIYFIS